MATRSIPDPDERPDYTHLPAPIRYDDLVESVEPDPAPDPDGGVDPETLFVLRNAGF